MARLLYYSEAPLRPKVWQQQFLVLLFLLMALHTERAAAQRLQLDATGVRIRFDTASSFNSASLSPLVEWQADTWFVSLSGGFAGFENGDWATQGRTDLSQLFDPFGPSSLSRVEAAGSLAGTYHSSNFRTASTRAEIRYHLLGRLAGFWAGGVVATGWNSADGEISIAGGPTLGTWARYATTRWAATFSPLRIQGFWFPELQGRASAVIGPLDLAAYAGWRGGAKGSNIPAAVAFGGGSATLWWGRSFALVVSGGSYPSDLLAALPRGRYFSAGLRIASGRAVVPFVRGIGRPTYERLDGSGLLRFRIAGARTVELVADWTGWEPVPMERASDGTWVLRVRLQPGMYRFNLRVNGETWVVPEGVAAIDDGFGGKTGLLIVP